MKKILPNLLNGNFEQSTRIVRKKNGLTGILWSNEDQQINYTSYFNRLFVVVIMAGFMLMVIGFDWMALHVKGEHLENMYPQTGSYIYYIGLIVHPFLLISLVMCALFLIRYLLPLKNIADYMNVGWNILIQWNLFAILGILPLALGSMMGNGGIFYSILSVLFIFSFERYRFMKNVSAKLKAMYGRSALSNHSNFLIKRLLALEDEKKSSALRFILVIIVLTIVGTLEMLIQHNSFDLLRVCICNLALFAYIILFECFQLCLSVKLTWYYVKKYPTEYRKFYKISDKLWYMSEKRAAKHPHVYPPIDANSENKNEQNK